jgi:hypothetical protein
VEFLFSGSPDYVIDTRRFSAPVRGDPMHGGRATFLSVNWLA